MKAVIVVYILQKINKFPQNKIQLLLFKAGWWH